MTQVKEATVKELRAEAVKKGIEFEPKATKAELLELIVAHDTVEETAALLEQAESAGIDVPTDATKADIQELLEAKSEPKAPSAAPSPKAGKGRGERRKITHVTDRGDWRDPFVPDEEDYLVFYGDDVSERTGARREGDEAVLSS